MTTFAPTNQIIDEYDNEQAIQHLQGGTRFGVLRLAKRDYVDYLREYCMEHGEVFDES